MKKIVAGNWKMNLGPAAAKELAQQVVVGCKEVADVEIMLAPSFCALSAVCESTASSNVHVGAQNVHWEDSGAFTGEVSVPLLREMGCSFAIVGHSERRHVFGEDNEMVTRRGHAAISKGFRTIFCIGETLEQRESGQTEQVLQEQLAPLLSSLNADAFDSLVIAYEPVWAIGTGKVASISEISAAHLSINELCNEYSTVTVPILYGGSVKPDNFSEIVALEHVAGGLIGGASLQADSFAKLIEIAQG